MLPHLFIMLVQVIYQKMRYIIKMTMRHY